MLPTSLSAPVSTQGDFWIAPVPPGICSFSSVWSLFTFFSSSQTRFISNKTTWSLLLFLFSHKLVPQFQKTFHFLAAKNSFWNCALYMPRKQPTSTLNISILFQTSGYFCCSSNQENTYSVLCAGVRVHMHTYRLIERLTADCHICQTKVTNTPTTARVLHLPESQRKGQNKYHRNVSVCWWGPCIFPIGLKTQVAFRKPWIYPIMHLHRYTFYSLPCERLHPVEHRVT